MEGKAYTWKASGLVGLSLHYNLEVFIKKLQQAESGSFKGWKTLSSRFT